MQRASRGNFLFHAVPQDTYSAAIMGLHRTARTILRFANPRYLAALLMEQLDRRLIFRGASGAKFYIHNRRLLKRSAELKPKQAEWIDSMERDSVFWDVGANVGVYSLYAASRGIKVIALEPEAGSFALLQRNADLNGFQGLVVALNIGLLDRTGLAAFQLADAMAGTPKHQVRLGTIGARTVVTFTASDLTACLGVPSPNHIKIDVDGSELSVVRGLDLARSDLRSVLCEVRDNEDAEPVIDAFERHGFTGDAGIDAVKAEGGKAFYILFQRQTG